MRRPCAEPRGKVEEREPRRRVILHRLCQSSSALVESLTLELQTAVVLIHRGPKMAPKKTSTLKTHTHITRRFVEGATPGIEALGSFIA